MYENFGNFLLIIFTINNSSFTIKKNDFRPGMEITSETTETRNPRVRRRKPGIRYAGRRNSWLDTRPEIRPDIQTDIGPDNWLSGPIPSGIPGWISSLVSGHIYPAKYPASVVSLEASRAPVVSLVVPGCPSSHS